MSVPAAGEDGKVAVVGAVDYASGRVLWRLSAPRDGTAFVAFLDQVVAHIPDGLLLVVLDKVGYHQGRRAKDWGIASHDRVRPLWSPA